MRVLRAMLVLALLFGPAAPAWAAEASLFGYRPGDVLAADQPRRVKREFGSLSFVEVARPEQAAELDLLTLLVSHESHTVVAISGRCYRPDAERIRRMLSRYRESILARHAGAEVEELTHYGADTPLDRETVIRVGQDYEYRLGTKNLGLRGGRSLHLLAVGLMASGRLFDRLTEAAARETYADR